METLTGTLVRLRPVRDTDFEFFASLRNDLRTQGWNQRLPPNFTAQISKERYEESRKREHAGLFAIETTEGALIGSTNYAEGPPRWAATFGIMISPEYWGKGHAPEAQELLLRFLFEERGLRVVRLWTNSWNERAMKAAGKLGFRVAARLRESAVFEGRVVDTIMMDLLREEFFALRGLEDKMPPVEP